MQWKRVGLDMAGDVDAPETAAAEEAVGVQVEATHTSLTEST
jgi:hypothetical protein